MTHSDSSAIGAILASPFQQRFNAGSLWGAVLVIVLCTAAPVGLLAWSLVADPAQVHRLQHASAISGGLGAAALLLAGWAMLVGNVLQQNGHAMARIVPGHVARLRVALLLAWALVVLAIMAGPGFAFDAPLAWACGAAGGLALVASALRWPLLWLVPFVLAPLLAALGMAGLRDSLLATWTSDAWLVTAIVVTAGILVLVAIVREQGHDGARGLYEAGRARGRRFARYAPGCAMEGTRPARPYEWWLTRQLARRDSTVESRLLLGLGRDLNGVFPWLAFSLLTGASAPALQATARLSRTRNEQALLALLPGVPRGARLNRWLSWQMSVLFLVSALWGLLLAGVLDLITESISPGLVARSGGDMAAAVAVTLLPQVVWQWRSWARLAGESGKEFLPSLAPFVLGGVALALHLEAGVGYLPMGIAFAAAAVAWCAWRWRRMGGEPTALPVGRLAR